MEKGMKVFGDNGYTNGDTVVTPCVNPFNDPLISKINGTIHRNRAVVENCFAHLKNFKSAIEKNRHIVPIHIEMIWIAYELTASKILEVPLRSQEFFEN